jgi:hypothetical protein
MDGPNPWEGKTDNMVLFEDIIYLQMGQFLFE